MEHQTNQLVVTEKLGKQSLARKLVGSALALLVSAPVLAAEGDVDLGIDGESLKSLILGLIAIIALIGTAYLTVLVSISAFQMIRRVIKG